MAFGTDAREFVLKIVADVKDATKGMETVEKSSTTMALEVCKVPMGPKTLAGLKQHVRSNRSGWGYGND